MRKNISIGLIEFPKNSGTLEITGGNHYRRLLYEVLSKYFEIETYDVVPRKKSFGRVLDPYLKSLIKPHGEKNIWIREILSTATIPFNRTVGRNILLFHHYDPNYTNYSNRYPIGKLFHKNLKHLDAAVVVSKYWRRYLHQYVPELQVDVIHIGFNLKEFKFKKSELVEFVEKYNLNDKPIIYIGNNHPAKGVIEVYNMLKGLDAYLITSGKKLTNIPSIHLKLPRREYLKLLHVSDVAITMSKFKEGWNITAHEAMLSKTPVIGSGTGGMRELLRGGGQIICRDFSKLPEMVEYALDNKKRLARKGYKYASQKKFTIEHFEKKWIEIITDMGE